MTGLVGSVVILVWSSSRGCFEVPNDMWTFDTTLKLQTTRCGVGLGMGCLLVSIFINFGTFLAMEYLEASYQKGLVDEVLWNLKENLVQTETRLDKELDSYKESQIDGLKQQSFLLVPPPSNASLVSALSIELGLPGHLDIAKLKEGVDSGERGKAELVDGAKKKSRWQRWGRKKKKLESIPSSLDVAAVASSGVANQGLITGTSSYTSELDLEANILEEINQYVPATSCDSRLTAKIVDAKGGLPSRMSDLTICDGSKSWSFGWGRVREGECKERSCSTPSNPLLLLASLIAGPEDVQG